jgi:hypothetical protein
VRAMNRCVPSGSATWRILAADAVAHNYFVPRQLAVPRAPPGSDTRTGRAAFETHLGAECARRARELILLDHARPTASSTAC